MANTKIITVMMENLEYGGATTHLKTLIKNKALSNAKFILAMRHPCDVITSCFFTSFKINDSMINFLN